MNNKYKMSPDKSYVEIFFSDGSFFIIDTCDFDEISKHSWYKGKRGYPICNTSRKSETGHKKVPVHKLILGNISELEVDHISGDKMDNRRKNLRVCTHQQNMFNQNKRKTNTTGYIGVCLH